MVARYSCASQQKAAASSATRQQNQASHGDTSHCFERRISSVYRRIQTVSLARAGRAIQRIGRLLRPLLASERRAPGLRRELKSGHA